jgi:hypothetical protein
LLVRRHARYLCLHCPGRKLPKFSPGRNRLHNL